MSDELKEAISALADGEYGAGDSSALFDKITHDPSSRATWERYHLLSDAIKQRLPEQVCHGLTDRVHDMIAREPVQLSTRRKPLRILKPLAGLGIAASVAAIAIVGVRSLDTKVVSTTELVATSQPAMASDNRWNVSPEVEARLNGYLVNHSEYVGYGMQGMLPYARIVSYDSSE